MQRLLCVIFVFILFGVPVFSQAGPDSLRIGRPVFTEGKSSEMGDRTIKTYSDSINSMEEGSIPTFLFNPCFDEHIARPLSYHLIDVRWAVIEKINNKHVLQMLVKRNDPRMKLICQAKTAEGRNIYGRMSVYEMLLKRLKGLESTSD